MKIAAAYTLIMFFGFQAFVNGQAQSTGQADTLKLDEAINQVITAYPSVAAAQQAVEEAEGQIGLARSAYYPTIGASASYSRLGPVQKFDIPNIGEVQLFPQDNYSASLNLSQLIYDFGRTAKNLKLAESVRDMSAGTIKLVRQNLAMTVISTYYQLLLVQESLKINDDQLKRLNEHLDFINRMKATGSATDYEILSTRVKISAIENRETDLKAGRKKLSAVMDALLGRPVDQVINVSQSMDYHTETFSTDSMLNMAMNNRQELKLAGEKEDIARIRYELSKAMNNPTLAAFASGGGKNGYIPNLNAFKANFTAGISLNIPLFDGYREKNHIRMAKAEMETTTLQTEQEKRKVSTEVIQAGSDLESSGQKVKQLKLQLQQAEEAYKLAQTNYQAGAITNLALLDAEITLSTSKIMLTQARIDYVLNLSRLKMALGEQLYTGGQD